MILANATGVDPGQSIPAIVNAAGAELGLGALLAILDSLTDKVDLCVTVASMRADARRGAKSTSTSATEQPQDLIPQSVVPTGLPPLPPSPAPPSAPPLQPPLPPEPMVLGARTPTSTADELACFAMRCHLADGAQFDVAYDATEMSTLQCNERTGKVEARGVPPMPKREVSYSTQLVRRAVSFVFQDEMLPDDSACRPSSRNGHGEMMWDGNLRGDLSPIGVLTGVHSLRTNSGVKPAASAA